MVKDVGGGAAERLSFASIDLSAPDSKADAVRGCDSLIHLASPFDLKASADPSKTIVGPVVSGACNEIIAADRVGLRRVVSCGSVFGMVGSGTERGFDHVYGSEDVNGYNTLRGCTYAIRKKEAQERSTKLADELRVDAITFNMG